MASEMFALIAAGCFASLAFNWVSEKFESTVVWIMVLCLVLAAIVYCVEQVMSGRVKI